jgi:hypothetical protein
MDHSFRTFHAWCFGTWNLAAMFAALQQETKYTTTMRRCTSYCYRAARGSARKVRGCAPSGAFSIDVKAVPYCPRRYSTIRFRN